MNNGSNVVVTWGTFEGSKGIITLLSGKNVTVYLIDEGYEVALSTDHIEEDEEDIVIINKIEELFAGNYIIKSKKVNELAQTKLINYSNRNNPDGSIIHYFTTPNKYKVGKAEFDLVLKATQMKNGKWWIQC